MIFAVMCNCCRSYPPAFGAQVANMAITLCRQPDVLPNPIVNALHELEAEDECLMSFLREPIVDFWDDVGALVDMPQVIFACNVAILSCAVF